MRCFLFLEMKEQDAKKLEADEFLFQFPSKI
jgi:hypothetical protein